MIARSAAVACLVVAACATVAPRPSPAVTDLHGLQAALAAERGHPVFVNYWATWCDPCVAEMPILADAARRHQLKGVRFISVSADDPDQLAAVRALLDRSGARFDRVLVVGGGGADALDTLIRTVDAEWTGALPATFVYDGEGKLVAKRQGPVDQVTIDGWLSPLEAR